MAVFQSRFLSALAVVIVLNSPGAGAIAQAASAKKPATLAELALYRGPDRQSLLEEGAKKEGTLTFYTTATVPTLVLPTIKAFNQKYPDIKVEYMRADTMALFTRITEEQRAGNSMFDVMDTSAPYLYDGRKIMQPYYSPELVNLEPAAIRKERGAAEGNWAGHWETCIILMYNTDKISKAEAPKTYPDLLNPKWKGKMTLPTTTTGIYWIGNILTHQGEAFVEKMAQQDVHVQNISGAAVGDLVASGEVPLTPATFTSNATRSLTAGAPVGVSFLEPVGCQLEGIMLSQRAPHPHAALLFIDFNLSKEAAEVRSPTYASARKDMVGKGVAAGPFKKWYYTLVPDPIKTHKRWREILMEKFVDRK
jgi:iron(III) transport system substrate-binding protein